MMVERKFLITAIVHLVHTGYTLGRQSHRLVRGIFLLSILLPSALSAALVPDTAYYSRYSFIRFVETDGQPHSERLTDEDFLDRAGRVIFKVNRYDVFTNDSLLQQLDEEVIPRLNRDSLRLVRLVLRGAASPEGPYLNNQMLGQRRAQVLVDFLRQRLSVPVVEEPFAVESVTEDYRLLCAMMQRAADPDLSLVQSLCNRHLPRNEYTLLKRNLQRVRQGELWERLLHDYFPELRATRMMLYFEEMGEKEPQGEPECPEGPKTSETLETPDIPEYPVTPDLQDTLSSLPPLVLPRREVLSVKTNLLFDMAYMPGYDRWCPIPNVALEFYPLHGHFTVAASFDCPWWQHYWQHKYFQIRNYQAEGRYYLRSGDVRQHQPGQGAAFRGLYFSLYAHVGLFGICFDANHGWEGEGGGAGIGLGYVLPLSRKGHWRLEFAAQVGYFRCKYDPYQFENPVNPAYTDHLYYYKWTGKPSLFHERQYRFSWFGPTRVGVTLSYDLLYRRRSRKSPEDHEPQTPYKPYKSNNLFRPIERYKVQ